MERSPKCIRYVLNKLKNSGTTNRKVGSVRKRKTTKRTDNLIIRTALKTRRITAEKLANQINVNVSPQTIRNRLHEAGFRSYVAAKKPYVTKRNIQRRLKCAKNHINWTQEQWRNLLWPDEISFTLQWMHNAQ